MFALISHSFVSHLAPRFDSRELQYINITATINYSRCHFESRDAVFFSLYFFLLVRFGYLLSFLVSTSQSRHAEGKLTRNIGNISVLDDVSRIRCFRNRKKREKKTARHLPTFTIHLKNDRSAIQPRHDERASTLVPAIPSRLLSIDIIPPWSPPARRLFLPPHSSRKYLRIIITPPLPLCS